jgi:probable HAF family extracellular repeat protein
MKHIEGFKEMKGQWKFYSLAFSVALSLAPTAILQAEAYTPIDFPGSTQTLAWAINKAGDIVGSYTIAGVTHAFKLADGQFTTIDYPGATSTDARGINNRGDISGIYQDANNVSHGFLLSAGNFTPIDFPNAASTSPWGVGPSGEVTGSYTSSGVAHAFRLTGNEYVTIDPPGSTGPTGTGINGLGEVSGICSISGTAHAFLLSDGEYTIFDVPGSTYTNSTALTAHGEVIGRYVAANGTGYGYLLKDGLFRTIAFAGASFTGSASMNERGDIVGRYQNAGSTAFHGFILRGLTSPCPAYAPRFVTSRPAVTHLSDNIPVTAANPGAPGEVLSLFATGLGPTEPGVDPGQPFPSSPPAVVTSDVEVRVNGKPAEVLRAIGLPDTLEEYRVDFRLPVDTPIGSVALQLSVGMAVDTWVKLIVH